MPKPRALLAWSSGKDSAWTLHVLRQQGAYDVVGLVTTINSSTERVAMHAVRTELLVEQAARVGIPLWPVPIPSPCSNAEYEAAMRAVIERARIEGVAAFAFGDLFLEDIRAYRQRQLADSGVTPVFPLWLSPTNALAHEMVTGGLRAYLTCVDPKKLPTHFVGRTFDRTL
jgi:diphthamide synthase (EF-2-diphthine--ammonia ligase)